MNIRIYAERVAFTDIYGKQGAYTRYSLKKQSENAVAYDVYIKDAKKPEETVPGLPGVWVYGEFVTFGELFGNSGDAPKNLTFIIGYINKRETKIKTSIKKAPNNKPL